MNQTSTPEILPYFLTPHINEKEGLHTAGVLRNLGAANVIQRGVNERSSQEKWQKGNTTTAKLNNKFPFEGKNFGFLRCNRFL